MFVLRLLIISLSLITAFWAQAQESTVRGLRVDPSYFYVSHPTQTPEYIAQQVVKKAKASGVNTLFVYAYNSYFGAYYPTQYEMTSVENGHGKTNIFKILNQEAKKNSLKTVAVLPVNNFKDVWDKKPNWRMKKKDGNDYVPADNMHLLSAWHPEYKKWLKSFYTDFAKLNPDVDGIEVVEPFIDYKWNQESDHNPVANKKFKKLYPKSEVGGQDWLNFRAQGLTNLIAIMNSVCSQFKKESYLVQTWPAQKDGHLFTTEMIKNNTGLDFEALLNLTENKKLNYVMAELMWQQWSAEYGEKHFNPQWTAQAAKEFLSIVGSRSKALIHVEISEFTGSSQKRAPSSEEFSETLKSVSTMNVGIDVYDQHQIEKSDLWDELLNWQPQVSVTTN
ncbi:hypothetical protein K2P97_09830 [bacterium]|nr:hypothetical protein [bacterium]